MHFIKDEIFVWFFLLTFKPTVKVRNIIEFITFPIDAYNAFKWYETSEYGSNNRVDYELYRKDFF